MANSIEWHIMDFEMWKEAQDWKHDAPRYYANDLRMKAIEKILNENTSFEIIGVEVSKLMGFLGETDEQNN